MNPLELAVKDQAALTSSVKEIQKLRTASNGMEANFFKKLVQSMRAGIKETHFGSTTGNDTYQDMFDDAVANKMAEKQSLGIGNMMFNSMSNRVINQAFANQQIAGKLQGENPKS